MRLPRPVALAFPLVTGLVLAPLLVASAAHAKRDDDHGKHGGGIPAVLEKLEEMQEQLDQSAREVQQLRTQVADLEANVTPCTLERFRNGLCGPDNHPLDLLVSVCGKVGADTGLALKYAFTSNLDVQAGVGWKDAPDVHIVENAQLPALISIGPVPVVLPSELAGQVNAMAGLGLDGCLAPIRIPIGKQLAEPTVIAILEGLEAQAQPIVDTLVDRLNGGGGGGSATRAVAASGPGMGLANLSNALAAADALRDQTIVDDDPMATFGRGPIADLAGSLPVGGRLASIVEDPQQLALPGLRGDGAGQAAVAGGPGPEGIFTKVCGSGGSLAGSLAPLCDFIATRVPTIDRVFDLIPTIEIIPDVVNDVVDGVRELLTPLFADVGETTSNTASRFCNSSVGQRRIFDRLCGR